jgi:hypothetical protein
VFYRYWLNDRINQFGYTHRDFHLTHRDWDTRQCKANGGKAWHAPESDPMLKRAARTIPTVKNFFAKHYPNDRFYLTNIQAYRLKPQVVRNWKDDLWLFPHYTNPKMIPHDVRNQGPASAAWPKASVNDVNASQPKTASASSNVNVTFATITIFSLLAAVSAAVWARKQQKG